MKMLSNQVSFLFFVHNTDERGDFRYGAGVMLAEKWRVPITFLFSV
jgi:hypothetical protein